MRSAFGVKQVSPASPDALRLVRSPEGVWVPDFSGSLPGEEMWLPFEPDVLWEALQGPWAEGVVRAETLMRARLLSDLGFARKQGRLSLGREKVIARLTKAGENGVLIHAIEASAGELRKLGSGTVGEKIGDFTTDELSHCSGGTYVVYAATEKRYLPPLFWRKLSQWRVVHAAMKDKVQA